MHFHRKRGLQQEPDLQVNGTSITLVEKFKFLGLIFDKKLYWKEHISYLRNKCLKSINLLKILSKMHWGADRKSLLHIYRATTRSQLDYGCQIYASAPEYVLKRLDAVHHMGIRLSTGAFRSSPVLSLMAETGELKLDDRRKQLCLQLHNRQQRLENFSEIYDTNPNFQEQPHSKPFSIKVQQISDELQLSYPAIMPIYRSPLPTWFLPDDLMCNFHLPKGKKDYSAEHMKQLFLSHQFQRHQNCVKIYTDGSKCDERAGSAVYSAVVSRSIKIQNNSSIYTAELTAIFEALVYLVSSNFPNVTIFSDSRSTLQGIVNIYNDHPIVTKIHHLILRLKDRTNVKLCWIPSHVNIRGNERADELAKQASNLDVITHNSLPHSDYSAVIKQRVREEWNQRWTNIPLGENKLRRLKPDAKDSKLNFPKKRRLEVVACRLRIGHTKLTHGHLMERRAAAECEICGDIPLSVEHILCECPQYNVARLSCFGRQHPTVEQVLGNGSSIESVIRFLIQTRLFSKI